MISMSIMTSSRRRVDGEKEQLCMKDICIVRVRIKKILLPVSCFNPTLTQVDLCLLSLEGCNQYKFQLKL